MQKIHGLLDYLVGSDLEEAKGFSAFAAETRMACSRFVAGAGGWAMIGAAKSGVGGGIDGNCWSMKGGGEMKGA